MDRIMLSQPYRNPVVNDFSLILQDVITVLALSVNLMLLRIVFTSHRREIGSYRYLIATFAVSDLSYTIIHWLVYPIPEMYGNAFILGGHGVFASRFGACVYCAVYSQASPILLFHFVYRTLNLRRGIKHPCIFFSSLLAAAVSVNLMGFSVMYCLFRPDEETLFTLSPFFTGNTSSPIIHHSETAEEYIQALYWKGDTYSGPRWYSLLGAFLALGLIVATYSVIIVCAVLINKYLRDHVAMSPKTLSLHHQLYLSIICQAVYPLITTYLPLSVSIFMPVFGINFIWVSLLCPPLCVSHPLFDALVLIFCMTDYRTMFLRSLGLSRCLQERKRKNIFIEIAGLSIRE